MPTWKRTVADAGFAAIDFAILWKRLLFAFFFVWFFCTKHHWKKTKKQSNYKLNIHLSLAALHNSFRRSRLKGFCLIFDRFLFVFKFLFLAIIKFFNNHNDSFFFPHPLNYIIFWRTSGFAGRRLVTCNNRGVLQKLPNCCQCPKPGSGLWTWRKCRWQMRMEGGCRCCSLLHLC